MNGTRITIHDPAVLAFVKVTKVLDKLSPRAQQRVMDYIWDLLVTEPEERGELIQEGSY